jgi:dTDP-4-amino-4,6-dideoxygalactose transaminase
VMIERQQSGLDRDAFLDAMNAAGIGTGVHYLSIPEHPYYQQRFGWAPEQWPHAMRLGRHTVSLPLSPAMSDHDVERVIDTVQAIVASR